MNINNESLYAQLGKKFEKVIENQRKCFNFVESLQKNIRKQSECISYQTLTKVVESQIQVFEAKLNDKNCCQLFSKNIQNSSEYLIDQKQSKNLCENEKQKFVANKQTSENHTSNEFLHYSSETQLNLPSKFVEMFTKKDENYSVFQDIQLNQKLVGNKQDFNVFKQSNCQQDQEYLQIEILNSNPQTDVSQENHQVKIFPHSLNQRNSSSAFNLSNFNSFNQNNTRTDTFDNEQESSFYRQQFVYLIKKIEMINGKKLSQKGIEKISQELGKIAFGNDNECDQVQNTLGDKIQLFDSTSKVLNKKNQTIEYVPSLHLKPKVLNRKVQQKVQQKSMNKQKNPDPIRFETKKLLNKQNLKTVAQTDKQKKKDHGRSISPLSYRVMMQKKKEKILKQQKNFNSSVNDKKFQSKQMNPSKIFVQKNTNYASKSEFQSQVKQKVNTLKIILDLNGEQRTTKTLCFQYSQKDKNLNDQIQDYCAKNNISGKNKKSICDAIQNHKPIVTLKQ